MTKNLETADMIVKLVLAIAVIILYFTGVITGPFAFALMILATGALLIFVFKAVYAWTQMD